MYRSNYFDYFTVFLIVLSSGSLYYMTWNNNYWYILLFVVSVVYTVRYRHQIKLNKKLFIYASYWNYFFLFFIKIGKNLFFGFSSRNGNKIFVKISN